MAMIKPQKFIRRPFEVEAIQVTDENMAEVAQWCRGKIQSEAGPRGRNPKKFIQVNVKRALKDRHTKAYTGDWVVIAMDQHIAGFKVYSPPAFNLTYLELLDDMEEVISRMLKRGQEEEKFEDEELGFAEELRESFKQPQ